MNKDEVMYYLAWASFLGISLQVALKLLADFGDWLFSNLIPEVINFLNWIITGLDNIFFKGFSFIAIIYLLYYLAIRKPQQ